MVDAKGLSYLEEISISRWTGCSKGIMELHGFCDASEKAYAATVYTKVGGRVTLLEAKSKVNPIKNKKTIPRLELCAAHLLAKLLAKVQAIWSNKNTTHAWSDSQITIPWIPNKRSKDKMKKSIN